jgi:hypothetical protein
VEVDGSQVGGHPEKTHQDPTQNNNKKSNKIECPAGMAQVVECWGSMCKHMALGSVPRPQKNHKNSSYKYGPAIPLLTIY